MLVEEHETQQSAISNRQSAIGNEQSTISNRQSHSAFSIQKISNSQALPNTMALFFDPNPRQLHSAAMSSDSRPQLGMKSRSQSGSGCVWLIVGGRKPSRSASAAVTMPAAPLAP